MSPPDCQSRRALALLLLVTFASCAPPLRARAAALAARDSGAATAAVRAEVVEVLRRFQEGYTRRDTTQVTSFVEALFAPTDVLMLGVGPTERYAGREGAKGLVRTDWRNWGDVRLTLADARVSSSGDVAWIITPGTVTHGRRVIPLRFSAVLVRDSAGWRFRHVQFQADVDPYARPRRDPLLWAMGLTCCAMLLAASWALARRRG